MNTESLVAGYCEYVDVSEIDTGVASDAPATTPLCGFFASFAFSYVTTFGPG